MKPLFIIIGAVVAVLAVFLVYTAVSGTTPALQPSNLAGHVGTVSLTGKVMGPVMGDSHRPQGLQFKLRNIHGTSPVVPIVYHGSVPDLFRVGRDIMVTGRLVGGTFVTDPGSLITKCPSKYTAQPPT